MLDSCKKTVLSTLLVLGAPSVAGCDQDALVDQHANPAAESAYEELTRRWLQWAMALPHSQSPIADETGERCAMGQGGPVWMLAGTFGGSATRACEIPAETPLFFPLINRWVIPGRSPDQAPSPEALPSFLAWVEQYFAWHRAHTCSLTLTLDGEPLLADLAELDEALYVAVHEPFAVDVNADNWATSFGKEGGLYPVANADGHYALLRPLPPGDHVLEFGGESCDDAGVVMFATSVVYQLHVAAGDDDDDQ
jgi:hypothetical protein